MNQSIFQWAVVGAGPAGIAAVGKLLDAGVPPKSLLWVDPQFMVGDFGQFFQHISSNTTVKLFTRFLMASPSFRYQQSPIDFQINHFPPDETCLLKHMASPLQWISDHLSETVVTSKTMVNHLSLSNNHWLLDCDSHTFRAKQVILATGAVADTISDPSINPIPFEAAIDKVRLSKIVDRNDTVAVFGSSHSAIMILEHLVDLGVKKIINFYRSPNRYAVDMGDWILFDNTGLKGHTAEWARQHLDGVMPNNLHRQFSNESNIARFLPECNQVIYAIGFKRRNSLTVESFTHHHYNPHVGIIGPGLFGLGIAYPEIKPDRFGTIESHVGLWKFMVYLNKVLPIWFNYPSKMGSFGETHDKTHSL